MSILNRAIKTHRIAQSYLFYGPKGVGKFTTALYFAMALNCYSTEDERPCGFCQSCRKFLSYSHPDFLYLFPSPLLKITPEGEIKNSKMVDEYTAYIEQKKETPWLNYQFKSNTEIHRDKILHLQHRISLSSSEALKKVFIIEDADKMNNSAANTFLKTLEEPPKDSILILTTTKPNALLPTILSRCQKIQFQSLPRPLIESQINEKFNCSHLQAKLYSRIASGNLEKAYELAESGSLGIRQEALDFIDLCIAQDDIKFLSYLEQYKSSKNADKIIEILSNLIIWFSDLALFQHSPDNIANLDQVNLYEHIFRINPNISEDLISIIQTIEMYQKNIKGHVNAQLVLSNLFFKVRKVIYKY